jgi:uncharacterized protein YecE (DUF72 family)
MNETGNFFSGTSNVVLPAPNKSFFPEAYREKTRLTYYGSLFNSVEVNSSFYKLLRPGTVAKWVAEVPDDFRFSFKLWKQFTHNKTLTFDQQNIDRFLQSVTPACEKKGSLLIQFPPGLGIDLSGLERLLVQLQHGWPIAVEFRNRLWYREETYSLLEKYYSSLVIHDMPSSPAPLKVTAQAFVYLRFHGPERGYRGSYDDAFLNEYAGYIIDWLAEGKSIYAYFNNTAGAAVHDLARLNKLVAARSF